MREVRTWLDQLCSAVGNSYHPAAVFEGKREERTSLLKVIIGGEKAEIFSRAFVRWVGHVMLVLRKSSIFNRGRGIVKFLKWWWYPYVHKSCRSLQDWQNISIIILSITILLFLPLVGKHQYAKKASEIALKAPFTTLLRFLVGLWRQSSCMQNFMQFRILSLKSIFDDICVSSYTQCKLY